MQQKNQYNGTILRNYIYYTSTLKKEIAHMFQGVMDTVPRKKRKKLSPKQAQKQKMEHRVNFPTKKFSHPDKFSIGIFIFVNGQPHLEGIKAFKTEGKAQSFVWRQLLRGKSVYLKEVTNDPMEPKI